MRFETNSHIDVGARAALVALWLACGTGARLHAQQAVDTTAAPGPLLFQATAPLELTIRADFGAIAKERGTTRHDHPGTLSYIAPAGDTVRLDVKLRTRGHFRLSRCQYAPLKVDFDKDKVGGTVFAGQNGLKLVGPCRSGRSYANYLLEEYLLYRVYNLLTDMSFKARLLRVTYVDPTTRDAPDTRYGFFIEEEDRMARRNRATVFKTPGVNQGETDPTQMGLVAVFQYFIGNTDWSVGALHNIVVLQDSVGVFYPVPYDFDWSGVISTPYAQPDPRLGIRIVRQRLYRAECRSAETLAPLFARFIAHKDAISALYRDLEGLEPKRVEQALDYYDEFYRTITSVGDTRREFMTTCQAR